MKINFLKKTVFAVVLAASLSMAFVSTTNAIDFDSITSDSIKEKQDQIKKNKELMKKLNASITNLKTITKDLESKKSNLEAYITELDAQLEKIYDRIDDLNGQIEIKMEQVEEARLELEKALEDESAQKAAMIIRMRLMYERKDATYLDILLTSTSLRELLSRADYIEKVVECDYNLWEEFQQTREYVNLCKEALELEEQVLEENRNAVLLEQENLETLIEEKQNTLIEYQQSIKDNTSQMNNYSSQLNEADDQIDMLQAAIDAEKKEILLASGLCLTYDGGKFVFPLKSYTCVSSDFGYRVDPITGAKGAYHNGIDFAAPAGTPIYAAYDGVVASATYSSSMGNYVIINHGDGMFTIYMHAKSLNCSEGDVVARGDTIAYVGTTGRSTGNHLHFTVRLNGEYVSPWTYINK